MLQLLVPLTLKESWHDTTPIIRPVGFARKHARAVDFGRVDV